MASKTLASRFIDLTRTFPGKQVEPRFPGTTIVRVNLANSSVVQFAKLEGARSSSTGAVGGIDSVRNQSTHATDRSRIQQQEEERRVKLTRLAIRVPVCLSWLCSPLELQRDWQNEIRTLTGHHDKPIVACSSFAFNGGA